MNWGFFTNVGKLRQPPAVPLETSQLPFLMMESQFFTMKQERGSGREWEREGGSRRERERERGGVEESGRERGERMMPPFNYP